MWYLEGKMVRETYLRKKNLLNKTQEEQCKGGIEGKKNGHWEVDGRRHLKPINHSEGQSELYKMLTILKENTQRKRH